MCNTRFLTLTLVALLVLTSCPASPVPGDDEVEMLDAASLEAVYAIRDSFKGSVDIEGDTVVGVVLHNDGTPYFRDSDFEVLRPLRGLRRLSLYNQPVTDAGLMALRDFEELEELNLEYTRVTGPGLANIAPLPKLRKLTIGQTGDAGLSLLPEFPALEELELWTEDVSNAGLLHLNSMRHLRVLLVSGSEQMTMEGVAALRDAPIEVLEIVGIRCSSDQEVASLSALPHLRELNLTSCRLTGGCLRHLSELTELTTLDVDCSASDDEIGHLRSLRNLRTLSFGGKRLTINGMRSLRGLDQLEVLKTGAELSAAEREEVYELFPRLVELR